MNYYEILGVSKDCSQAELRAAYRERARELHPDVNRAPDATERMAEVNAAYSVLKAPAKRFEYDQQLEFQKYETPDVDQHEDRPRETALEPIVCERCGAMNETLSVVGFDYVVSVLILSWRGRNGGVYCDKCRTKLSLLYTLEVLFFGWWGVPFGALWSIAAIFRNVRGGVRPPQPNAQLQAYLAGFFVSIGQFGLAFACAKRSYQLSPTKEVRDFMNSLEALGGERAQPPCSTFWRHSYVLNIAVVASIIIGISMLLSTSNPQSKPSAPSNFTSEASPLRNLQSESSPPANLQNGPSLPRNLENEPSPPIFRYGAQREYDRELLGREIEALKLEAHDLEDDIASLSSELQSSDTEMADIKNEIDSIESRYMVGLEMNKRHYDELREEYNARVPVYNMKVKKSQNLWEQYDSLVDEINDKVAEYNQGY